MQPASITPMVCAVMGTPSGRSILGIMPMAASSAANKATSAMRCARAVVNGVVAFMVIGE